LGKYWFGYFGAIFYKLIWSPCFTSTVILQIRRTVGSSTEQTDNILCPSSSVTSLWEISQLGKIEENVEIRTEFHICIESSESIFLLKNNFLPWWSVK
jgi:hypothetical protein